MNWQLDGVPRNWTLQNVCEFLTIHNWTDVLPISKPLRNRGWIVRAAAPDTAPCHVFELSNASIVLHLASTRAPKRRQHPIARAGCDNRPTLSKWSKDAGVVGQPPAQSEIAATQLDSFSSDMQVDSNNQNAAGEANIAPGEKRESDTQGLSPEKRKVKADHADSPTEPFGYKLFDCGGQGDCGYRAAAAAYALESGRDAKETKANAKALGATLRAQVASHLKKHHHYKASWSPDSRWTQQTEGGPVPKTYDQWLEACARPGRWVCGPTLVGIATRLKRNLIIFRYENGSWSKVCFITPHETCAEAAQQPRLSRLYF